MLADGIGSNFFVQMHRGNMTGAQKLSLAIGGLQACSSKMKQTQGRIYVVADNSEQVNMTRKHVLQGKTDRGRNAVNLVINLEK